MLATEDKIEIINIVKNEIEKYHLNVIEKMEANIIGEIRRVEIKVDNELKEVKTDIKEMKKDIGRLQGSMDLLIKWLIPFTIAIIAGIIGIIIKEFLVK